MLVEVLAMASIRADCYGISACPLPGDRPTREQGQGYQNPFFIRPEQPLICLAITN
jgi:hypothetical protein